MCEDEDLEDWKEDWEIGVRSCKIATSKGSRYRDAILQDLTLSACQLSAISARKANSREIEQHENRKGHH